MDGLLHATCILWDISLNMEDLSTGTVDVSFKLKEMWEQDISIVVVPHDCQ